MTHMDVGNAVSRRDRLLPGGHWPLQLHSAAIRR